MAKRKKAYYPEGQIQKGLYTQGGEWMFENGVEYIGDYHRYPGTNETFTKGYYIKDVSEKLIPYVNIENLSEKEIFQYDKIKSEDIPSLYQALYTKVTPSEADYENGYFIRYFVKRHFQSIIQEVDKDTFSNAPGEFFVKSEVPWKLRGPLNDTVQETGVYDTNQRTTLLAEKNVTGIRNYITDYTEYARISS